MQKDNARRAEEILDGYYRKKLRPETEKSIQGWIASKDNPYAGVSMAKRFSEEVKAAAVPDKNTQRSLKEVHKILGFPQKASVRLARRLMRVAAVLVPLLVISGGILYFLIEMPENKIPQIAQIEVQARGSDKELILPDGSIISLTEGTECRYGENFLTNRTVTLDGEAYFAVEKRAGKTFTVRTNSINITVRGTEFNVKAYDESETAEVVLTTGTVEIEAAGLGNTVLSPGEKMVYDKLDRTITVEEISQRELLRLRGMSIDFDNSLDEIFRSVAKYFGKPLIVNSDTDLSRNIKAPFTGKESVEEVMDALQFMTGNAFGYTIKQDTIRVTNPGRNEI